MAAMYYRATGGTGDMSTTGTVWHQWVTNSTATTASTLSATDIWIDWCGTGTTDSTAICTTSTAGTVWRVWNTSSVIATRPEYQPRVQTPAEIAEQNARVERYRAEVEVERSRRVAAEERAELLLVQNLNLEQKLQFQKDRSFVVGGKNGYRYRIRQGRSGNIDMVKKDGLILHRLCAHPSEAVPDCDTMLAQKIMLEIDEDFFLKTANRHHVHEPSRQVLPVVH